MKNTGMCWLFVGIFGFGIATSVVAESTADTQGQSLYHEALALHQKTPKAHHEIFAAYVAASQAGSADASFMVAQSYYQGRLGQKQDVKKAQAYIDQAIAAGSAQAKILQAEIWLKAQNREDRQKAIQILQPLEKDNLYAARHLLAMIYLDAVNSTEAEIGEGLKLLQQNQRAGYVPSVEVVAWMFENGHLVAENLTLSKQLYEVLAKNQVPNMQTNIERVNQKIKARAAEKKL